jgi:hypothetical protein
MMRQTVINRLILFSCSGVLAVSLTAAPAAGQQARKGAQPATQDKAAQEPFPWLHSPAEPRISIRPVMNFADQSLVPASGTMLVRTRDNVFATVHTAGLPAGTVVTAWFAFFNNPQNCATRPCSGADFANPAVQGSRVYFGGQTIGVDGTATFGAFRRVGDTTGIFDGPGLLNPLGAEIHLVMRSHGPAILNDPAILSQQLSTFNGGCPPNACANLQASVHQP